MRLVTRTGQQIPCEVTTPGDGGAFVFYAVDDSGNPVSCLWVLTSSGAQTVSPKGTVFTSGKSYFFGSLGSFTSAVPVSVIAQGPASSMPYFPPAFPTAYSNTGDIQATLQVFPQDGSPSLQVMIRATDPTRNNNF
jgi:hypothetical protein